MDAGCCGRAITSDAGPTNQYPPGIGLPVLRDAVAAHQEAHYGITLDPAHQVLFTTGATEGIAASILSFAEPGSEVVAFEPWYDSYGAMVALAGAELRTVPLEAPNSGRTLPACARRSRSGPQ